jgi:hypothetical protein
VKMYGSSSTSSVALFRLSQHADLAARKNPERSVIKS